MLLLRALQTSRTKRSSIQSMQPARLRPGDKRIVRDGQQIFSHEPNRLLGSHPLQRIKPAHLDRPRKNPQRPPPAQVEVSVEVTDRQFAQRTITRLPIAASSVIRLRQSSPVPVNPVNGDDG